MPYVPAPVIEKLYAKMKFRRKIYIKVYQDRFVSRIFGNEHEEITLCNELSNSRTLLGDWRTLESSLKQVLSKHCQLIHKIYKPVLLIHLIPTFEGGYTTSELRLFQELGQSAGAHFCFMCEDKYGPLSNEQIKAVFRVL